MRPGVRLVGLVCCCIFAAVVVKGQTTTLAPTATTPAPSPTIPSSVAVVPTLRTYADALAFSRRWHNSTLLIVRDATTNDVAKAELADSGVLRGWLGASLSDVADVGFVWIDGVPVGGAQRPYTNWAPGRPKSGQTGTAIAMDEASGYWFDVQQGSPQPSLVMIPNREATQTLPLPQYTFKPASAPPLRTPPWQTAVIIGCTLLIFVLVGATIGLIVWHIKTPLRIDNKSGFLAPPPSAVEPPPPPPVQEATRVQATPVVEWARFLPPDNRTEVKQQLGQPLNFPGAPPEPSPASQTAPPAPTTEGTANPTDGPKKDEGTVVPSPPQDATTANNAPTTPSAAESKEAAGVPADAGAPPAVEAQAAEENPAEKDDVQPDDSEAVDEAAETAQTELPPPPSAVATPGGKMPLGAPSLPPPARKLPPPMSMAKAPPAARTLPGAKAIGGAPPQPSLPPSAAAPKRPGPPAPVAAKGPQPIPIVKGPTGGAKGPQPIPIAKGPGAAKAPPPTAAKAALPSSAGSPRPATAGKAPGLSMAKTSRKLPPARPL